MVAFIGFKFLERPEKPAVELPVAEKPVVEKQLIRPSIEEQVIEQVKEIVEVPEIEPEVVLEPQIIGSVDTPG